MLDLPDLNAAAAASTTLRPSAVSDDLSNSKNTVKVCRCGATAEGGGAATGVAAGGGVGTPKWKFKPTRKVCTCVSNRSVTPHGDPQPKFGTKPKLVTVSLPRST